MKTEQEIKSEYKKFMEKIQKAGYILRMMQV